MPDISAPSIANVKEVAPFLFFSQPKLVFINFSDSRHRYSSVLAPVTFFFLTPERGLATDSGRLSPAPVRNAAPTARPTALPTMPGASPEFRPGEP